MPPLEPVLSLNGLNGLESHAPVHIWHLSGVRSTYEVALQLLCTGDAQTVPRVQIEVHSQRSNDVDEVTA